MVECTFSANFAPLMLHSQGAELQLRCEDAERSRADYEEKLGKLHNEAESLANQLEETEGRSSVLAKQVSAAAMQHAETLFFLIDSF
jgi:chromosome segregation ATPase